MITEGLDLIIRERESFEHIMQFERIPPHLLSKGSP